MWWGFTGRRPYRRELSCSSPSERAHQPRTVADAARLRQILVNLLDNAMKFTSHGRVRVQVAVAGGALCYSVEDTGIGIPAESLESVFETFSAISAQTSASVGGTGLGLEFCDWRD